MFPDSATKKEPQGWCQSSQFQQMTGFLWGGKKCGEWMWPERTSTGACTLYLYCAWPLTFWLSPSLTYHTVHWLPSLWISQRLSMRGFLDPNICFSRLILLGIIFIFICFIFTKRWLHKPTERVNSIYFTVVTVITLGLMRVMQCHFVTVPIVMFRKGVRIAFSLPSWRALAVTRQDLMYYLIDIIL